MLINTEEPELRRYFLVTVRIRVTVDIPETHEHLRLDC